MPKIFSLGIPVNALLQKEKDKLLHLDDTLSAEVIGQVNN